MSWTSPCDSGGPSADATVVASPADALSGFPQEIRVQSNEPAIKHETMLFFLVNIVHLLVTCCNIFDSCQTQILSLWVNCYNFVTPSS